MPNSSQNSPSMPSGNGNTVVQAAYAALAGDNHEQLLSLLKAPELPLSRSRHTDLLLHALLLPKFGLCIEQLCKLRPRDAMTVLVRTSEDPELIDLVLQSHGSEINSVLNHFFTHYSYYSTVPSQIQCYEKVVKHRDARLNCATLERLSSCAIECFGRWNWEGRALDIQTLIQDRGLNDGVDPRSPTATLLIAIADRAAKELRGDELGSLTVQMLEALARCGVIPIGTGDEISGLARATKTLSMACRTQSLVPSPPLQERIQAVAEEFVLRKSLYRSGPRWDESSVDVCLYLCIGDLLAWPDPIKENPARKALIPSHVRDGLSFCRPVIKDPSDPAAAKTLLNLADRLDLFRNGQITPEQEAQYIATCISVMGSLSVLHPKHWFELDAQLLDASRRVPDPTFLIEGYSTSTYLSRVIQKRLKTLLNPHTPDELLRENPLWKQLLAATAAITQWNEVPPTPPNARQIFDAIFLHLPWLNNDPQLLGEWVTNTALARYNRAHAYVEAHQIASRTLQLMRKDGTDED